MINQEYLDFCKEYKLDPKLAISLGIYYTFKELNKENKEKEKVYEKKRKRN